MQEEAVTTKILDLLEQGVRDPNLKANRRRLRKLTIENC